ncbi:hypothetical protein LEP1GSC092_0001 [Leptospira interrogans serovar Pyrogenes str. R168]|nr:hypothetical protein LEP1GSC092_0001 [Leptospira interrogans serovar Pyrogenes str. R168]
MALYCFRYFTFLKTRKWSFTGFFTCKTPVSSKSRFQDQDILLLFSDISFLFI